MPLTQGAESFMVHLKMKDKLITRCSISFRYYRDNILNPDNTEVIRKNMETGCIMKQVSPTARLREMSEIGQEFSRAR